MRQHKFADATLLYTASLKFFLGGGWADNREWDWLKLQFWEARRTGMLIFLPNWVTAVHSSYSCLSKHLEIAIGSKCSSPQVNDSLCHNHIAFLFGLPHGLPVIIQVQFTALPSITIFSSSPYILEWSDAWSGRASYSKEQKNSIKQNNDQMWILMLWR